MQQHGEWDLDAASVCFGLMNVGSHFRIVRMIVIIVLHKQRASVAVVVVVVVPAGLAGNPAVVAVITISAIVVVASIHVITDGDPFERDVFVLGTDAHDG